ncbi:bifunctional 5,10-methylenetetrahydrofolate dehydrogenase/5,10-methenyltetrahydrofolate cyclohydrolase [Candidatus Woesearchaeota archaeon]|nr:bifunctional 5,10-methylenetetrahydrofolate dehydrogenase/5,10-methenyltetrahydrofolate cyclohydrolase [Candidatus Woesearchaeota archaeon]
MTAKILDGKKVAQKVFDSLRKEISSRDPKPRLAIIRVGDNPASKIYTSLKKKRSEEIGINTEIYSFQENINEKDLLSRIKEKEAISEGIIVQLPLPRNLDEKKILNAVDPQKDVDGFTAVNLGKLLQGEEKLVPATPKGIIRLLEEYNLSLEGKRVVIVNRSVIVGKPLVALLLNRGATVTICHSQTKNVAEHTRNADVLISAVGKSKFITSEMVKEGAVVIDVGISKEEGRIVGDVDFEEVLNKASYITPVPGGVGPMTVAMLLENVMLAQSFYNKFKKVKK